MIKLLFLWWKKRALSSVLCLIFFSVAICLQVIKLGRNENSIKETNLQVLILLRYLTRLQMIQFVCVFIHALLPLYFDCGYPKIMPKVI